MRPFHRILVATDLTAASEPALAEAVEMAKGSGGELLIAFVYQPPNLTEAEAVAGGVYDEWVENLRERAARKLEPVVAKAKAQGLKAEALVLSGNPEEAIIQAAESKHADLVILGTHGRRGVSKFFLGSVASRVIASAPCPVLTVRAA